MRAAYGGQSGSFYALIRVIASVIIQSWRGLKSSLLECCRLRDPHLSHRDSLSSTRMKSYGLLESVGRMLRLISPRQRLDHQLIIVNVERAEKSGPTLA